MAGMDDHGRRQVPPLAERMEIRRQYRAARAVGDDRHARPTEVTMSPGIDGSAIDNVLREAVEAGAVPHVAAIAADRDGIIYEGGAGARIVGESGDPVSTSTQFRVMSMTKMVCTAAALQQVERGEMEMQAPIDIYCPEFADVRVLEGFDGDQPKLRPAGSRATVRQLMTHTTGLGYWFWNADLARYEKATGLPNVVPGSAEAFKAPMV